MYVSLSLPDICGALESDNGVATGNKYKDWFNKYVAHAYTNKDREIFTAEDCYYFRCSLLHQGTTYHPKSTYIRILFVEPDARNNIYHNNIFENALNIDVRIFCRDIISGAEKWLAGIENNPNFMRNSSNFIRRHPNGFPPYIYGMTVIG